MPQAIFTRKNKRKKAKKNRKSGLFELIGLKEYQVKPYFDIDAKGGIGETEIDKEIKEFEKEL